MSAPAADDEDARSVPDQSSRGRSRSGANITMTLTTRLAIAMILLVAVTVAAVGWLGYRNTTQAVIPRVLERVEAQSRLLATNLESYVAGARGDLVGYRSAAAINGLIRAHVGGGTDALDGVSEQTWRERIATRLAAEIEAKPSYGQFRIIGLDDDQRELVRVDRSGPNGAARIVPNSELESKGERTYFHETIQLAPCETYVSPIDLATRQGGTADLHIPTLRVAMPLFTPDGKPFGIIIANIDMRPALDRIRSTTSSAGEIYVVNSRGDYLVHPDRAREFGSLRGHPTNWRSDFPFFAALAGTLEGSTQLMTDGSGRRRGDRASAACGQGMGRNHRDSSPVRVRPRASGHSKNLLARRRACRPRRGFTRSAPGALINSPDRASDRGGGGDRQRTASRHTRRCKRRDGRAGAGFCPDGRGDAGENSRPGARGP